MPRPRPALALLVLAVSAPRAAFSASLRRPLSSLRPLRPRALGLGLRPRPFGHPRTARPPRLGGGLNALLVLTSSESPYGVAEVAFAVVASLVPRSPLLARSARHPTYPRIAFPRSEVGGYPLNNLKFI